MNRGVEAELKSDAVRRVSVDRVDAYSVPERVRPIYQIVPKTEYGVFSFMDRDFTQDVQLSLHIIRRIVDRRYKFNLIVPGSAGSRTLGRRAQEAQLTEQGS